MPGEGGGEGSAAIGIVKPHRFAILTGMFGNLLGWAISAVIVVGVAIGMTFLYISASGFSSPGPVGQNAASWKVELPLDPRSLATWMTEDQDAIAIYKEAIAEYKAKPRQYNAYLERGKLDTPEYKDIEKGVNLLIKAAVMKRPGVFADRPAELITYDTDRPALKEALRTLAKCAMKVGRQLEVAASSATSEADKAKAIARARDIYRAVYSLGVKLYEERIVFDEWFEAREMLAVSRWLGEIAESAAEASRFKEIDAQIPAYFKSRMEPVQNTIQVLYPRAGDLAALAANGGDLMWRVEAILALGRVRYTAERTGDQLGATRLIEDLLADPDPRIKIAAQTAKNLTRQGVHRLR
jgi:hypothetical protein